jgi:hypothetical protein
MYMFICKINFLRREANALLCAITRGSTASKLISDESSNKNASEKELDEPKYTNVVDNMKVTYHKTIRFQRRLMITQIC